MPTYQEIRECKGGAIQYPRVYAVEATVTTDAGVKKYLKFNAAIDEPTSGNFILQQASEYGTVSDFEAKYSKTLTRETVEITASDTGRTSIFDLYIIP